ncbi:MAG TPA: Crp/Fnr family transcriptional regulator [Candidatus Saccharimonadales bacterium]|nr:Crp/Fnr family transcriptional regulator [Candidatus Saccharimonadales bacterium]
MTIEEKIKIMKTHPLFKGLDNEALDFIARRTQEKIFRPHTIIIHHGEQATAVYIIYKGLFKIYITNEEGKQIPVRTTGEKYFVGDLGVVDNDPVPATVETLQETHVFIVKKEDFNLIISKYTPFAINLLHLWGQKVRGANRQREINYSLQLKDRTMVTLHTLASYFPNHEITLSHEELASILGATRSRVTEVLNEFEKEKRIALSNRKIKVL